MLEPLGWTGSAALGSLGWTGVGELSWAGGSGLGCIEGTRLGWGTGVDWWY